MRRFCVYVCVFFLCVHSFAQESFSPIVKEYFPVKGLAWDSTDRLFAYMEEDIIFLRDLDGHRLIGTIDFPGVLGFSLYYEEDSDVQVIAGSTDGTFAVWSIPTSNTTSFAVTSDTRGGGDGFPPDYITNVNKGNSIDVLAFSENANYVAEHFVDGANVGVHFRLRYTNELVSKNIENYPSSAYTMAFSSDNACLAVGSLDGTVRVWDSDKGNFLREFSFDSQNKVHLSFIPGNYNILVTTGSDSASVIDPTGYELMTIKARSPICQMRILSDGKRVGILTEQNRLEIYNLETGKHLGYLPSFNVSSITSFDFSADDKYILMGHEDGSIYKVEVNKNLVAVRNMPVLRLITEDEVLVKGDEFTESIPQPVLYLEEMPVLDEEVLNPLYKKPSHGLEFLVGTTFLPKPHLMNLDLSAGYINNILLHPFYLGAHFTWSLGFPDKNFPHDYVIDNERIDSPLLLSFALGVPFGIILTPFEVNRDIELSAEVNLGSAFHYMWNRKFGGKTISSHIYPAFVGSLALGIGWKGFTFRVHGDYNTQLGFMFSMNLGYTLTFPSKGMK